MKDILTNFVTKLRNYESIAIIGLGKNAGKTTTLNSVLKLLDYENVMLTSIGYDGEDTDLIFSTSKPTIFVKKNTIIATAKKCILNSEIQFEILETTGFSTPLGEIIVVRCLDDGLIELAGPSYNYQLTRVIDLLKSFNPNGLVLVDGALNRKTSSNPSVCDATILASGMSMCNDMDELVIQTKFVLDMLCLAKTDLSPEVIKQAECMSLFDNNFNKKTICDKTTINQEHFLIKELTKESKYLILNGPLTDKLLVQLIKSRNMFDHLEVIVPNGTTIFVKKETYQQSLKVNIKISVVDVIDVIAIAMNPKSLTYLYDSNILVNKMKEHTDKFVHDFIGSD